MTLVELLVVVGLMSVLAAVIYPVFATARAKARQANCTSQLRQVGHALVLYVYDFDRPPYWVYQLCPTYLSDSRVLACSADPFLGRGGWISETLWQGYARIAPGSVKLPAFAVSYFDWGYCRRPQIAKFLAQSKSGAYIACILHGSPLSAGWQYYGGLTLRLRFDGSVRAVQVRQPAPNTFDPWRVVCDDPRPSF